MIAIRAVVMAVAHCNACGCEGLAQAIPVAQSIGLLGALFRAQRHFVPAEDLPDDNGYWECRACVERAEKSMAK